MTTINRDAGLTPAPGAGQGNDEIANLINSGDVENKLAQQMKGLSSSDAKEFLNNLKNDGRVPQSTLNNLQKKLAQNEKGSGPKTMESPYRASSGEASSRKGEMGMGAMSQQIALNNKLAARNAAPQQGTLKTGSGDKASAGGETKGTPEWLANPKYDLDFYQKLSKMPDKDLKQWVVDHPDQQVQLREGYNNLGNVKMDPATRKDMEGLGEKLGKFRDEGYASALQGRYANKSPDDIAKDMIDRIHTASSSRNGAADRQSEVRNIMNELRILAQSGKGKSDKTYAAAMEGFTKALHHKDQNVYSNGSRDTIPMAEVVEKAVNLQGPGSAAVKADLIQAMVHDKQAKQLGELKQSMPKLPKEMMDALAEHANDKDAGAVMKKLQKYEKYAGEAKEAFDKMKQISTKIQDEPNPGAYIESLIKSDPGGVTAEFESRAQRKEPIVLDEALKSVYLAHRKDPDKAASLVGEMMGTTAADLAEASKQRPMDEVQVKDLGHRTGFLLRSAQTMVQTVADDKKKMIDEGEWIAKMFGKAVSKLSGFPVIEKATNKVVDNLKDKEYKGVAQWQKGIEDGYKDIIDAVLEAQKPHTGPGSQEMTNWRQGKQWVRDEIRNGIATHQEFEAQ